MQTNLNKHIWEGWTVGNFIEEINPTFDWIVKQYGVKHWINNSGLKEWIKQEQPYYKKHIPEVYNYFLNKLNTNK
tara:strand:- start:141 stop:365 length:225 start_codon:yes stop_codon:yes gene_type:complete